MRCWRWVIFVYAIVLLGAGVTTIIVALILTASDKEGSWDTLSSISKEYYNNNIDDMFSTYQLNMILAGLFSALVGGLLFLQFFMICYFFGVLMEDWDPQFRYRPIPRISGFRNVLREKTYEQYGERERLVLLKLY